MKQLVPLLLLALPVSSLAQQDCDNHAAIGISYILPKGISVEGAYFTKSRLTAGIGVAYTIPTKTVVKAGANEYETVSNTLDVFAYAGYKFLQVDYVVSAFVNAGYIMGDVNSLQPFVSTKVLFPAGRKSFSVEPFYVFNRGVSARASVYIKL
ncbi:MAG: hypothetical protein ACXWWD_12915 [Chitinophagaceae bacterium]